MDNSIIIKFKKYFFVSIILFLCFPLLQAKLKLIKETPLNGAIEVVQKTFINKANWYSEEYQTNFEKYNNQNFGFRNLLVRLNNQIGYSCFNLAKANGVIVGKQNYLYETNYIKAYTGTDYIGQVAIAEQVQKLKKLQDTLQQLHKTIVVVLAPGKGSLMPEFIPDNLMALKKTETNYGTYVNEFNTHGINYLDFNKWFITIKPTAKYPLCAQAGIHWSKYGEYLATDSLIKYIGKVRQLTMPQLVTDSIVVSALNKYGDYDVGEGLNLLYPTPTYPMAYPYYHFNKTGVTTTPKVLVMADSYYWGMFNKGISSEVFNNGKFWYYNQQIFPDNYTTPTTVADVDMKAEVEKHDVIMLLSTDANLYKFPYGFINQLYATYFEKGYAEKVKKEQRIKVYIHNILQTPDWLAKIKLQATNDNVTLDEAVRKNAEYIVWEEDKNTSK